VENSAISNNNVDRRLLIFSPLGGDTAKRRGGVNPVKKAFLKWTSLQGSGFFNSKGEDILPGACQ